MFISLHCQANLSPTMSTRRQMQMNVSNPLKGVPFRIAGLAIFREQDDATSWLLLQNTCGPWTPPKGHLEAYFLGPLN